ncbi:DNA-directed DNA polymerase [Tanacetum coccineum]
MATRMSLELANRSIQYPRGIIENVLIKVDKFVLLIDFVILDMPKDSRVPIILGRPFLATARAMIDVFNKKITLRVGDDEVIFNVDQLIKRPPTEDDECYGINDLGYTINAEAQELLANEEPDSFLSRGLEKSVDQADLESCKSVESKYDDYWYSDKPIRRIESINTPYLIAQETKKPDKVESEHLYSASANEIDEKKLKLKNLPHHLEYAYLHGDKSFPIIISSELSEKEKISLLQVLEKRKGVIAWKMSDIKGISPSYCTHKILMEDDFKPVIQPQRRLNLKVQDVVKNEIVKLLDFGLIYLISDSSWVSPIHVVPDKGGMTVDFSRFLSHLRIRKRQLSLVLTGLLLIDECRLDYATHRLLMTAIFHDMVEDFMEVFMDDFSVFSNSFDCYLANLDRMLAGCEETNLVLNWEKYYFMVKEGIVLGHKISRAGIEVDRAKIDVIANKQDAKPRLIGLENPDLGTFTEEEITDEFPDEHLMLLKAKLNNNEPYPQGFQDPLILGRPFLSTAHAIINVFKAKITLSVGNDKILFKSNKPISNIIKRVYALSLIKTTKLGLETRLMGNELRKNKSQDPKFEDFVKLNCLNEPIEHRRNQVKAFIPTIKEGEGMDEPIIDDIETKYDNIGSNEDECEYLVFIFSTVYAACSLNEYSVYDEGINTAYPGEWIWRIDFLYSLSHAGIQKHVQHTSLLINSTWRIYQAKYQGSFSF